MRIVIKLAVELTVTWMYVHVLAYALILIKPIHEFRKNTGTQKWGCMWGGGGGGGGRELGIYYFISLS